MLSSRSMMPAGSSSTNVRSGGRNCTCTQRQRQRAQPAESARARRPQLASQAAEPATQQQQHCRACHAPTCAMTSSRSGSPAETTCRELQRAWRGCQRASKELAPAAAACALAACARALAGDCCCSKASSTPLQTRPRRRSLGTWSHCSHGGWQQHARVSCCVCDWRGGRAAAAAAVAAGQAHRSMYSQL